MRTPFCNQIQNKSYNMYFIPLFVIQHLLINTLFMNRVFRREKPVIEMLGGQASGRLPNGYPYCTDNKIGSCCFADQLCVYVRCAYYLNFLFGQFQKKYKLLNSFIGILLHQRVPLFHGNSSYSNVLFCGSIVQISEMCILLVLGF